jgi:tungstate transport system ATP-binding protein
MRRSVVDCIAYPLRLDGMARAAARARASEIAGAVGLADALDKPAQVLSGGEKQKLALARALIRGPEVLFLDEPCASLDGRSTRDIEAILLCARDNGTRIVMSTHDIGQARRLADEVWFLYGGLLCEAAESADFFELPRSEEAAAYLKGELLP